MPKLNNTTQAIRLTRGIASELTSAEHAYGQLSQLLHITDTNEVYIHNGTEFVPIVTSAEKTILSNTSGVNTGDQDISGIATNASNITGKVSKSGDTMTGNLAVNGSIYSSGNLGASNRMTLAIYNDTNYSDGLSIYKSGSAGVLGGAVKDGGEVGYHSFYAFDGTSDKRVAFVLVGADGDTTPTTGGGRYDIYVRNSAGTQVLPLSLTGANAEYQVNPIARTSLTYNLGSTARYWLNTYTQKLYLNSTAYLDGSTAGRIAVTGVLYSNTDVEITDSTKGVILKSPDGSRWRITIDNTGALNSTSI